MLETLQFNYNTLKTGGKFKGRDKKKRTKVERKTLTDER